MVDGGGWSPSICNTIEKGIRNMSEVKKRSGKVNYEWLTVEGRTHSFPCIVFYHHLKLCAYLLPSVT